MQYKVVRSFLDAKGRLCVPGNTAPAESDQNIALYLSRKLIAPIDNQVVAPEIKPAAPSQTKQSAPRKTRRTKTEN